MAEDGEVQGAVATPEATTGTEGSQQDSSFAPAELRELFDEVLTQRLAGFQQQMDRRFTNVEQLKSAVEELGLSQKQTDRLVRGIAKGVLTEDDRASLEGALDKEASDAQAKAQQARAERAEAEAKAAREANDGGRSAAWAHAAAIVEEVANDEKIPEATVMRLKPDTSFLKPTQRDPFGYNGFRQEWVRRIRAENDKAAAAKEEEVVTPGIRGGGAKDGWAAYEDALKTGKPLPSAAEIDRLTAARFG